MLSYNVCYGVCYGVCFLYFVFFPSPHSFSCNNPSFSDYPCPPFKLIILDEADSLTSDAQTALRRVIEQYSRSTRFCLICNYVSRIIDPLTSRCAKFRFGPVAMDAGVDRLAEICAAEGVEFEGDNSAAGVLGALMDRCGGDLRRGITLLQGSHRLGRPLSVPLIDNLAGTIPINTLQSSLDLLSTPTTTPTTLRSFVLDTFAREALPATQFLHQLVPHLLMNAAALPVATDTQKALICDRAAEVEARICDGGDEVIQILDFFMATHKILNNKE